MLFSNRLKVTQEESGVAPGAELLSRQPLLFFLLKVLVFRNYFLWNKNEYNQNDLFCSFCVHVMGRILQHCLQAVWTLLPFFHLNSEENYQEHIAEFSSVDLWLGIQEKQMYSSNFLGTSCQRLILIHKMILNGNNDFPDCCFLAAIILEMESSKSLVCMTSMFWQQACQICATYWSYCSFIMFQSSMFSFLLGLAGGGRAWVASHATAYFYKKCWEEMKIFHSNVAGPFVNTVLFCA